MNFETLNPHLESQIERLMADRDHGSKISIIGSSSLLSIAYFIAFSHSRRLNSQPHLFVVPKESDCAKLAHAIEFFDPNKKVYVMTEFDVSPYSGLYPSPHILRDRLLFLSRAQNAKPGEVFIASFLGLQQKTIPVDTLIETTRLFRPGDSLPESLSQYLIDLGYESAPLVEDVGQFAIRGGIVDIFSPGEKKPVRIELFGDQIETLRFFSTDSLKSEAEVSSFLLTPAKETLYVDGEYENIVPRFRKTTAGRDLRNEEVDDLSRSLVQKNFFPGIEFLISSFYENPSLPLDHFSAKPWIWYIDPLEIHRISDDALEEIKSDFKNSTKSLIRPPLDDFFSPHWLQNKSEQEIDLGIQTQEFYFSNIDFNSTSTLDRNNESSRLDFRSFGVQEFSNLSLAATVGSQAWMLALQNKLSQWKGDHYRVFVSLRNATQAERLKNYFEHMNFEFRQVSTDDYRWDSMVTEQNRNPKIIHFLQRPCFESLRIEDEKIVFLREEDFFGKKSRSSVGSSGSATDEFQKQAKRLNFGDLKPGDLVVHVKHGIGQYEGLKVMLVDGVDSEFIQLSYKEKDRLYLPVYRVGQLQKYSGAAGAIPLDKLGGTSWEKTKVKVRSHLKDIASELLTLYAKRAEIQRPAFHLNDGEIQKFENGFPYEETEDQQRSIRDIYKDMKSNKPMDRLVCGDVGFGKTEVAMRAVFFAVESKKQVAVLAPTTVLTFQHFENFKKRFKDWPIVIKELNRFVSAADVKKTLVELKEGKVDIIIGTHRLLSKDVVFKDLGLLVVDEEQKFGVVHKEKIKKMKTTVDTLALSATPIPRTLNMSLVGIRDLSLINTAPVDRLPTRTFICKWEEETIRKAIESEVHRGGQVYFIHNRVQTIYGIADELRAMLPNVRMKVAHGQMDEDELEKTMLAFFNHEIDMLVSTAIVESGMDVARANTMFIDQAQLFGLSQLYQLRGRVGRSKQRAYCYLLLPRSRQLDKDAQERLKIIQENTQLGSGIKIAQYDLELRGSGNILGDDQSGHVNTVGYELYMDLLNEALAHARGEEPDDNDLDPEINLKIPAMIPDAYIPDIRMRLSYYKALAEIKFEEDVEKIEDELKDQFGALPEPVVNLIGVMLVRKACKDLGIRDVSAGIKKISLVFTEKTKLSPESAIKLAGREPKKYSITPDSRLNVRMEIISWSAVYEELKYLLAVSDGNDPKDPTAKAQDKNKSLIRRMGIFN
ncbi:MAG: transcription-repair coupling factor [Bdellovibrionaceae bacterium]|nr:transcription-repair coupling factor [Pseudobdellovibrionaceae bacterium]